MPTEENKAIVRCNVEEFLNKGNLAVLDELYGRDFVYHSPNTPAGDLETYREGLRVIRAAFSRLARYG